MKKTLMMLAAAAATTSLMNVAVAAPQAAQDAIDVGSVGVGPGSAGGVKSTSCRGNAGRSRVYGGSGNPVTSDALFIKTGFDIQCSNNVLLQWSEVSANAGAVASGSLKGNQSFNGQSNGGAIVAVAKCTGDNDQCVDGNVDSALDAAIAAAQAAAGSS